MGFGLAPPPPPAFLSGVSGFGSGGSGGGGYRNMVGGGHNSGGISGRSADGMGGAGGIGSSFVAPSQQASPRKRNPGDAFEERRTGKVNAAAIYNLPSAESTYRDYARHVDNGLAGEAWRRQGRQRDRIERTIDLAGKKSDYAAAMVTVGSEDGMTGSLTPDLTLGL